jgi:flagellar L-ring protein precursor FlgH
MSRRVRTFVLLAAVMVCATAAGAANKQKPQLQQDQSLQTYIAQLPVAPPTASPESTGSLWVPGAAFTQLARDYKSYAIGDVVTIVISVSTVAQDTRSLDAERAFAASSGITALPGKLNTSGVASLFSPTSSQTLTGKGAAASNTTLTTAIGGQVVAIVSGGMVVLQAQRDVNMNNEKQTVIVRGVARPGDIGPDNSVASSSLANLQVEVKGKGVLSDAMRQPNVIVRALMKILNF